MIELGRITVVKCLADDGATEVISTSYSDGMTLVDALGMLAFAATFTPEYFEEEDED